MKKYKLLFLAILGGFLLFLAWPPLSFTFLLFVGFVPLLLIEDEISKKEAIVSNLKLFKYTYLFLFVWNSLTTWWVSYASIGGGIMSIVLNALLLSLPILAFHITKKRLGYRLGYISLIIYWLAFEYIHHAWEFTYPWLTLGNGLSMQVKWIQWYEYTGTSGGSLWILMTNIFLFFGIKNFNNYKVLLQGNFSKKISLVLANVLAYFLPFLLFVLPIIISKIMYSNIEVKQGDIEVVVVQPNIDPYGKFNDIPANEQLDKLINLSKQKLTQQTVFLVWPETALPHSIWLDNLDNSRSINTIKAFLEDYPNVTLIAGASAYLQYESKEEASNTARKFSDGSCCYDAFNTALQIRGNKVINTYNKSKLVPGVERIPYPSVFKFLDWLAIDMGGTTGSLGTQDTRTVFFNQDSIGIAPVICYESIFGDYVGGYIQNGAQLIFIITNDAWWDDTPGYKQHLYYGALRAIEQRKTIARSANTGVSCFINERGDISQATNFWEDAVISAKISKNDTITFYAQHGDYLGRLSIFMSVVLLLLGFVSFKTKGFTHRATKL